MPLMYLWFFFTMHAGEGGKSMKTEELETVKWCKSAGNVHGVVTEGTFH